MRAAHSQRGFTYFVILLLVAVTATGAAALGTLWHTAAQREKELELLAVGHEFRRAIGSYLASGTGLQRAYPRTLGELVLDPRDPGVRRHLRRIHTDPMTGRAEWGLVPAADGGIAGVYSLSQAKPLKVGGFDEADREFTGARSYSEWRFVHRTSPLAAPPTGRKSLPAPGR